ncbi:MAG: hypothetical protein M1816_001321 [Peltula sp. TS41687]|nr:MAG: hypothetical protein M1816_001321 [Peltula sp. TS41687]
MATPNPGKDRLKLSYLPQLSVNQPRSSSSTANNSPIESSTGNNPVKSSFTGANGLGSTTGLATAGGARLGAGSPSHELGSRLFPRRAREIQAQERMTLNPWGPPTSGNSTPLRENIPESPTDGFPGFKPSSLEPAMVESPRRTRAGTLPSRFSPPGPVHGTIGLQSLLSKTSRPTPVASPRPSGSPAHAEHDDHLAPLSTSTASALLSRLRSGSMPQRNSLVGPAGPFGPTLFAHNWTTNRERAVTLSSIGSNNVPSSPAQSSFSKDGLGDNELRTLDYLGLADTPQPPQAILVQASADALMEAQRANPLQPFMADLLMNKNLQNLNRFRSYSVNAKEKYAEEEEEELGHGMSYSPQQSGSLTPSAAATAAAMAATQLQIHQHNLAVQAFANQASASRPRARTAGVLEAPPQRTVRNYLATPSRLDNSFTATDLGLSEGTGVDRLPEAVEALRLNSLGGTPMVELGEPLMNEQNQEAPTRALWLGSIPASTTVTSLNAIFGVYGKVESARVLIHKNCGFVNFETTESAIQARSMLNGKEIFPGAGPIRIGYAKVPNGSSSGTPGAHGLMPSPSPEPSFKDQGDSAGRRYSVMARNDADGGFHGHGTEADHSAFPIIMPALREIQPDILETVKELGATDDDRMRITNSVEQAVQYTDFQPEIPPIPDPGHGRMHDAPRLREIRKRIDNNACSHAEIEDIAVGMLSEIAELASDYLGNTVVQKLFEFCSEPIKQSMLAEIAPHLAEIGVHKNGTWAAQKIIDVAKTPAQLSMIIESLRPYTVPLFLDQYGNYVLQCVLQFGAPWNNFIFETMLSRMPDIAQGRFGARAMRACLESHHATKAQQRMLAAAIALYGVQLSTNPNGALLLTWYLDTCTFPHRRTVLAPRLIPHLVQLCTHKVAYLTVLKVVNQRNEPEARDTVLDSLFFSENDRVLEEILRDSGCGATLIFKVLTTPFFDEKMRSEVVQHIRTVLLRLKAQPAQGYKRLMDEVGLSVRGGGNGQGSGREHHGPRDGSTGPSGRPSSQERPRPVSQHRSPNNRTPNNRTPQPAADGQYHGQYLSPSPQMQRDPSNGAGRTNGVDPNTMMGFEQFGLNGLNSPMFTPSSSVPMTPLTPQQLQYQQALMSNAGRPTVSGAIYPAISPIMAPYPSPSPSMDSFRGGQGQFSPMPHLNGPMGFSPMFAQGGFTAPPYNQMIGPIMPGGYQFPTMNGVHFVPQLQAQQAPQLPQQGNQQGNARRGRVS